MQGVSVEELCVGVNGSINARTADHTLTCALELAVGQKHSGQGGGVQNAAVGLHLGLLELQQAVSVDGKEVERVEVRKRATKM